MARRLNVVVDILAYEGILETKFAKLMIDRLRILENIIEISRMNQCLESLESLGIKSRKDYELFYGKTERHIEYLGTNYELIPNILVSLRDRDTPDKFLVEKENPRDIFITDYDYPCLQKPETMKNKMPLYRSSGTNFSTRQKGMLSPFQGKAFKAVVLDDYAHSDDCDFRDVLIEIVNHLFPKVFENNSASYRPDGSRT